MPYLEISEEALVAPTRLDLSYISAVMLYPDDEATRQRFFEACRAEAVTELSKQAPAHPVTGERLVEHWVVPFVREAPRLKDFDTDERFRQGILVGAFLYEAVGWQQINPRRGGLGRTQEDVTRRVFGRERPEPTRARWWRRFRPVSPLWAAHEVLCREARELGEELPPFPCRQRQFSYYLGISEALRRAGEATITRQAHEPLLPPGEAFAVPSCLAIPRIAITFERPQQIN